jgi:hypothetical protein
MRPNFLSFSLKNSLLLSVFLSVCLFVLFSLAGRRAKGGEREGMNAKWKGWGSVQIVKAHFSWRRIPKYFFLSQKAKSFLKSSPTKKEKMSPLNTTYRSLKLLFPVGSIQFCRVKLEKKNYSLVLDLTNVSLHKYYLEKHWNYRR